MSDKKFWADFKNVLYVDRIYAALQILNNRRRDKKQNEVDLALSELRLFSQNGEDGVLDAILQAIGDYNPYFVEFGVGDGWSCNCRLLSEVYGWNGLFLERDANECSALKERYINSRKVTCANEAVTPSNINELFCQYNVPEKFGVLSIDIDGQDYWTWKALDRSYQPEVVIIEFNSALEPNKALVEKEGLEPGYPLGRAWGASLKALTDLGKTKGYRLVHIEMAGVNLFFVREEAIHEKNLAFRGIIEDRSPNFGLRGRNHSEEVLYGSAPKEDRPQVQPDID